MNRNVLVVIVLVCLFLLGFFLIAQSNKPLQYNDFNCSESFMYQFNKDFVGPLRQEDYVKYEYCEKKLKENGNKE